MPKVKLSDDIIKAAEPRDKIYALNDSDTPGLQCVINPSGKKTFRLKTRKIAKKIGVYPFKKYLEAKKIAIIWHGKHLDGEKLGANELIPQTPTKKTLDQLIEEYLQFRQDLEKATIYKYMWVWKKVISPSIGNLDISEISDAIINRFLFSLKDRYSHALFSKDILIPAFKYGKKLAYAVPSLDYQEWHRYKKKKRKRYLTPAEFKIFWEVLENTERASSNKWGMGTKMCQILKLLILTGCRRNEVLTLEWSNVFLEEGYIQLRKTKNDQERSVPLLDIHKEIFSKVPRVLNSPFVFPSLNDHYKSLSETTLYTFWENFLKKTKLNNNPETEKLVIHSLRHTYTTVAQRAGLASWVIQALVGHSNSESVTGDYIHLNINDLKLYSGKVIENLFNDCQNSPYGVRSETLHSSGQLVFTAS